MPDNGEPENEPESTGDDGVPWRAFFDEARNRLAAAGEDFAEIDARRIVEEAAGCEPSEFTATLDNFATTRGVAHFDAMLERRLVGEPLQYVLGRWGFRTLDLAVDARVLIPRPETETVAGLALDELRRVAAGDGVDLSAADLGTGSGCIGLSLVAEHPTVTVTCTDVSPEAVAAARQNAAGLGRPARRIEIRQGSWFDALDPKRRGTYSLIVSNPPYIADHEELPELVEAWEPSGALRAGPDGLDHARVLINGAGEWLHDGGALVLELGSTQLDVARDLAVQAGWSEVEVHEDLAGRDRALVARTVASR